MFSIACRVTRKHAVEIRVEVALAGSNCSWIGEYERDASLKVEFGVTQATYCSDSPSLIAVDATDDRNSRLARSPYCYVKRTEIIPHGRSLISRRTPVKASLARTNNMGEPQEWSEGVWRELAGSVRLQNIY
jgi:hypothetical protein